jgi:hypothetical protein
MRSPLKKRSIQGISLTNQNFFAILDNMDISDLTVGMGINVSEDHFETFDLMKDIEIARHALDNVKKSKISNPNEIIEESNLNEGEIPLLQWLDDDYEAEQFTLVQSRKKKKKLVSPLCLKNPKKPEGLRSQRIGLFVYRGKGGQENPVIPKKGVVQEIVEI